jgi:hypothetical protein
MASGFAIRREQIAAINRMLDLNRETDERGAWHDPWKILVYDAFCRDVISPLLKKGDLRKRGITLHLLIDSARDQIADVPAIYFVQPTKANVDRLGSDCAAGLYEAYYLNFTPAVPRVLLEDLAAKTLASENVGQIGKVMDQYLNFSSLEDDLFSLLVPESFVRLNGVTDSVVEAAVEQVVTGLFSTLVTLGVVPVLRYPRGGAAQMVAELLGRRLHDQLKAHSGLFSEAQGAAGFQRPLLVLMERSADLGAMMQHAWSYSALCHDLLGMKLNRVTIDERGEGGGKPQQATYDLHQGDPFWVAHIGAAFQTVAADVDRDLNEYREKMEAINQQGAQVSESAEQLTSSLASTINELPELQEKKRLIDAHMNIATELLRHIKARGLDSLYSIEESLIEGRSLGKEDKATLAALCSAQPGAAALTPDELQDRLRLLLLLHLHKAADKACGVERDLLEQLEALLRDHEVDLRAFGWLQQYQAHLGLVAQAHRPAEPSGGARGVFSTVMKAADQSGYLDNARFLKDRLAAGVKQLLPGRRDTAVTRAVSALMDNRGGAEEESFAYLDPKLPPGDSGSSRSRSHYTQAIVFMCGPGNYLEYLSIREQVAVQQAGAAGAASARNVLYGCAEMQTPSEFLAQVAQIPIN